MARDRFVPLTLNRLNLSMSLQIYINGRMFPKEDAKISVYDHGLLYGDGVFEGMRSYNGRVFRLKEHMVRLYESARAIALKIPIPMEEMEKGVNQTLQTNSISDGYIRLVVTRGAGALGLDPNKTSDPQVIIIADHIQLYPKELYEKGLDLITAATIRNHPAALSPRIKSLNYLNNIMAKMEGLQAGCVEALMLNHKGEVAECTGDNIFIIRNGELWTPPIEAGILEGVTRNAVLDLWRAENRVAHERPFTRHDIFVASECFLTGSAAEVIPVVRLDQRPIGDGTVGHSTKEVIRWFHALVRRG
jgi:branched-chain amino acid aminotransferase